jgi:hypothetical protein
MTADSTKQKQGFGTMDPGGPKPWPQIFANDPDPDQSKYDEDDYWYENWYDDEDVYGEEESNRLSPSQGENMRFEQFKWIDYTG